MRILRELGDAAGIDDAEVRLLIEQRFAELGGAGGFDASMGYFVLVEPGDRAEAIEARTGCPILTDDFSGAHYGEAEFTPGFEWLLAHPACFEMAFVWGDLGIGVFLPRTGIDPVLLALCEDYAVPAGADSQAAEDAAAA
jgi:hypothetical protein